MSHNGARRTLRRLSSRTDRGQRVRDHLGPQAQRAHPLVVADLLRQDARERRAEALRDGDGGCSGIVRLRLRAPEDQGAKPFPSSSTRALAMSLRIAKRSSHRPG